MQICGFQNSRSRLQFVIYVIRIDQHHRAGRLLPYVVVEVLLRRQPGTGLPGDLEILGSLCCLPLLLRDYTDEVVSHDHLNQPWNVLHRLLVHVRNR